VRFKLSDVAHKYRKAYVITGNLMYNEAALTFSPTWARAITVDGAEYDRDNANSPAGTLVVRRHSHHHHQQQQQPRDRKSLCAVL
jgi:hypothetical protein